MKTNIKGVAVALLLGAGTLLSAGKNVTEAHSPVEPVTEWNVALSSGTLGVGIDIAHRQSDSIAYRANINGFKWLDAGPRTSGDFTFTNNDLLLLTAGALVDYYPTSTSFRLTGGLYFNGNKLSSKVKYTGAAKSVTLYGKSYSTSDITSVQADLSFAPISPYIGLGWGNNPSKSGLGFTLDVGLMYHSPKVVLTPTYKGTVTAAQKVVYDKDFDILSTASSNALGAVTKLHFYPVIRAGISYSF